MKLLIIGGLKHCGKTSLGRVMAKELGYHFFDLDDLLIEAAAGTWESAREIWRTLGKEEFLKLEERASRNFVDWVMPSIKGGGVILSLGGGTISNKPAMGWLKNQGLQIYVRADANLLFRRIMAGGNPPFLSERNPWGDFLTLYQRRDALYRSIAHLVHDVDDAPIPVNARRLLQEVRKRYGG